MSEHGIENAFYANGPWGCWPVLECTCGFSAREQCWEDAGLEFDLHLEAASIREGAPPVAKEQSDAH